MKLNIPNKLTILRFLMVPIIMVLLIFPIFSEFWTRIVGAALFLIASITDTLDGSIARKYNLITDFGKFLDPIADKILVIGTMLGLLNKYTHNAMFFALFVWTITIVVLRELAVTSMRMLAVKGDGKVIAANNLGKIKTVTQVVALMVIFLEPILIPASWPLHDMYIASYVGLVAILVTTVISGVNYIVKYWKYIDPQK